MGESQRVSCERGARRIKGDLPSLRLSVFSTSVCPCGRAGKEREITIVPSLAVCVCATALTHPPSCSSALQAALCAVDGPRYMESQIVLLFSIKRPSQNGQVAERLCVEPAQYRSPRGERAPAPPSHDSCLSYTERLRQGQPGGTHEKLAADAAVPTSLLCQPVV